MSYSSGIDPAFGPEAGNQELWSLADLIASTIRSASDLDAALEAIANRIGSALSASDCLILRLSGGRARVAANHRAMVARVRAEAALDPGMIPLAHLLEIKDTEGEPWIRRLCQQLRWPNIKSALVAPMIADQQAVGAIIVGRPDQSQWSDQEKLFIQAVAATLAQYCRANPTRGALGPEPVISSAAEWLCNRLSADSVLIARRAAEEKHWEIERAHSARSKWEEFLRAFDIGSEPVSCGDTGLPGARAFAAAPIMISDKSQLAIIALMCDRPRAWRKRELDLVVEAAEQICAALERAELSQGYHEWEAAFDAISDGLFIFNRDGFLRKVNQAGAALEGAPGDQLIGRRCCSILKGLEDGNCYVRQVIQTRRPVTFELTPKQLSRPLLVTISPLINHTGVLGAVCIVRDLSELRAAETAARQHQNFLAKLIEQASEAIFALSPDGRFIWFNEQLCKLSGYTRQELMQKDYKSFLELEEKRAIIKKFARILKGEYATFEMRGRNKEGQVRLLKVTSTPIYDGPGVSSVLCIARDITEERLAAERAAQADKLRALGQLASGVAHNFNNILAAIVGCAQLIKRQFDDEAILKHIDVIERAALDGAQTVKRIQGFALQNDESARETLDINQIVQDSATLTRARWEGDAQARGIHYKIELKLGPVLPVCGSASELREVFVNIILNALDAMPTGGTLQIETEAADTEVKISFADTGTGMSRQVRERIFEPFFTTKGSKGMGLGLSVSYGIIKRHGGRIDVQSQPGRGSTFTITLPSAESSERRSKPLKVVRPKATKILIIDDDERVRQALVGMLQAAGYDAESAASGREGLQLLDREDFELVITDLAMPDMDGWTVAAEIRHRRPDIKIALLTGYAVSQEMVETHSNLVDAVILKPIRLDEVTEIINRTM